MSATQVTPGLTPAQSPFRPFGEYDIRGSKYVIDPQGYWRPASVEELPSVTTAATLQAVSQRCTHLMGDAVAARQKQNTLEMELHFDHTLFLAKKVILHARRQWDWIPFIGWIFGNIAAENVRKKFEPVVDKMQFYLERHATHVLAAKDESLTQLGLKIDVYRRAQIHSEIVSACPQVIQTSATLPATEGEGGGPILQLQQVSEASCLPLLPPMEQHVVNLFTHGEAYGFHSGRINYASEAEEILRTTGGHLFKGSRFLFWKKEEDRESFQVFVLPAHKDEVQKFSVSVYNRGDQIQYDFGSYTSHFVPSKWITAQLPDFPIPGETEQTKIHCIEDYLHDFCSRI